LTLPSLLIQITKRTDGGGVLRCVRQDGSVTWQKQNRHAAFFSVHDLTHYAVESTLGLRRGFFGLIAEGWDVEDTTGKGARGPLPDDAAEAESIVGMLDAERAGGALWTAREFNEHRALHHESRGRKPGRELTDEEMIRLRARRAELLQQWFALPPGATFEMRYERPSNAD
jgi:hypothetical protein